MMAGLRELYHGPSDRAVAFRYGLLIFDLVTIVFVIATSFFALSTTIIAVDLVIGLVILIDFTIRFVLEQNKRSWLRRPGTWADIVATISFLAPLLGYSLGFLRVLRTLRLLRSYELLSRLRIDFPWFRAREDLILAVTNLMVFLFIMTGLIYATQVRINPEIRNYADALYFTVATLTTTGFGDITLDTTGGRMLSVVVMIVGVSLFLNLLKVLFRPPKVRQECPTCGLQLHDSDAVHCKHCGGPMHIDTEGAI
nr:ion transporter [Loktanella fryxellensis]